MPRSTSPAADAIRQLVRERKGNIKASEAVPILKERGFEVTPQNFNVVKHNVLHSAGKKKAKRLGRPAGKTTARTVTLPPPKKHVATNDGVVEALKYVTDAGGYAKAKTALDEREAQLDKERAMLNAFRDLTEQVKAAS